MICRPAAGCARPDAEIRLVESGHFALESHLEVVTAHIRDFLGRVLTRA